MKYDGRPLGVSRIRLYKSLFSESFRDGPRDRGRKPYAKLPAMWMRARLRSWILALIVLAPVAAAAQTFDSVGTRARGMGGAFVAVADDGSAVYWNPAGLAGGAYFSLVLDGTTAKAAPDPALQAGKETGGLLALSTPALGISYYRLRTASARLAPVPGEFQVEALVTHHAGVTLVHSLTDGIAVGATVKLVRGTAAAAIGPAASAESLLDEADLLGRTGSRADLDVGLMARGSLGSLGLTLRNLTEPSFETGSGTSLDLDRQARAGASILLLRSWKLAADADLTRNRGPVGDRREVAVGTEGQITRRFAARSGLRLNTAGDRGRAPAFSAGASFAVTGAVLIDAQVTTGSDEALRGWGIAGRAVF